MTLSSRTSKTMNSPKPSYTKDELKNLKSLIWTYVNKPFLFRLYFSLRHPHYASDIRFYLKQYRTLYPTLHA